MGRDDSPLMETWLAKCPVAAINDDAHLFALSFSWPLGDEYFIDLLELSFRGVQLAILLPDLIPLRHRWTFYANYPEGSGIDQFKVFCKQVVPECFNVLTISSYAERDIQRMLLEDSNRKGKRKKVPKTHVLKLGADWCTPFENTQISAALPSGERLVKNSYLLYVSSLDVRKNHEALLKAVAQVRKVVDNLDLVLVGRVDGSISAETLEFIRRSSWVHHFEGVDDATLHRLYVDCLFTVFPSLDEGYGLPVVESLRHGKFCLASQAGAIPEAGGAFADYFDPCDVGMLAEKILLYITNPEELQKREKLLASYRPTSWRETARQVAQIFYGDMAEYIFMAQESTKRPFV
jgi:glycosyltransferase involved in cell wall biosynthesis